MNGGPGQLNAQSRSNLWIWPFYVLPFLFYFATVAPTIGTGDTAILLDAMRRLHLSAHVNNHAMAVFFGWVFGFLPFEDLAYRGNLMSAFFAAVAMAFMFRLILRATGSWASAVVTTVLCMVSHSMWWHGTIVENYSFNALFTILYLYFLVRLRQTGNELNLYLLFMVSALAMSNHVQMSFFSVGAGVCLLMTLFSKSSSNKINTFIGCCVGWGIGILPFIGLILADTLRTGEFYQSVYGAFFGSFEDIMLKGSYADGISHYLRLVVMQCPSVFLVCILAGMVFLARSWKLSRETLALWVPFFLTTGFFSTYNTWDKFAFLLPSFLILFFVGGYGLSWFMVWLERRTERVVLVAALFLVSAVSPVYLYANLAAGGDEHGREGFFGRWDNTYAANSHRSNEYIANPNKRGFTDVGEFIHSLFKHLPRYAIYIDDDSRLYYPVEFYQKHYKLRPDLRINIINSWDIPGWGLARDDFLTLIRQAYEFDRDLFLISTSPPFTSFLADKNGKPRYDFKKFPLDDGRWIYRLITAKEEAGEGVGSRSELCIENGTMFANIGKRHVSLFHNAWITDQEMAGFGPLWHNDDQLFARINALGSSLEFVIDADKAGESALDMMLTTGPDFGVFRVAFNSKVVMQSLNLFDESVRLKKFSTPPLSWNAGHNTLIFELVGRDELSDGTNIGVDVFAVGNQ